MARRLALAGLVLLAGGGGDPSPAPHSTRAPAARVTASAPPSTPEQQAWVLAHLRKPVIDRERDARIYEQVRALAGAYVMP
ncbi:MAG: hypothetical protein WKF94_01530 [Solirubrobacteraceae bacterium]